MSSPLLVVELVLRQQNEGVALDHLGRLIADYLGPDRNLPLSDACKLGSTTLLDWMWERSPVSTADRPSRWSLTNYLRSDPHYYQYQFRESMVAATKQGDLRVIQWLMERFSVCQVPVSVVEIAAKRGRLDILQFLLEHDAAQEGEEEKSGVPWGNVVHWGGDSMERAALVKRFDIVRFIYENTPGGAHSYALGTTIRLALDAGEMALAEELLPAGGNILDYGKFSSSPVVLERSFAAGLLNDELHAGVALEKLVQSGSLELMKKIWQKHGQLTSTGDWMQHWLQGMVTACKMGDLVVLQWVVEHTSGRAAIAHLKEINKMFPLLYHATFGNQLNVMQYLQEHGAAADYGNSLLCAIRIDNMDAVTWLVEHFPPSEKIPEHCVLVEAARYGRDLSLKSSGNLSEAALATDHVRVGHWCLTHLPAHSPTSLELSTYTGFEVLLFVHLHYPELFTPRFLAEIRARMGFSEAYDFQEKWLYALVS
ncbi:hypothetical protein PHYSODRAFT_533919 [Phytophthora sojae]|uniref:Uncharacterized protein n=1 Tax=Phytophthora sojae (strain P6497) TaxID=1094619 RepID=G5AFV5_PHYSP|nr:hypothetical protein PHYSODRAFT_533919 [Phytophthora sojae]EGZ05471.1 hypothetical protein PHYSODRAFT_533919 [Phytophthora sojae]|eukprot:XP_009539002.1 hypothetical protein PHYSODRAFT_533919 [Phytophthora sojae]